MDPAVDRPQFTASSNDLVGMQFLCIKDVHDFIKRFQAKERETFVISNSEKLPINSKNAENLVYRKLHYACKFGGAPRTEATGVRKSSTFKQGCSFSIKIGPTRDREFLEIKTAVLRHENHPMSKIFHESIPENRRLSPVSQEEVKKLLQLECNKKLLQNQIIQEKEKHVTLKDLSNIKTKLKCSDDKDLVKAVKLLENEYGATVEILHEDNQFKAMFFITNDMKNSMLSWPEIVLIDGTYMLLETRLTVMLLIIEDGDGHTEVVGVGLLAYEDRTTFHWFLQSFKDANAEACSRMQCMMGDKDLLERDLLKEVFPGIPIYICRFHTLKTFKRAVNVELAGSKHAACLKLLEKLVYSSSDKEYDKTYIEFQNKAPKAVREYFDKNWHVIRMEWTAYSMNRGNLNNMTNNRLESMNGKIKQVVNKNSSLVEFIKKFFIWLQSHNFEINTKTANVFLKKSVEQFDCDEEKFRDQLMPFPFKQVLAEIRKSKYVRIDRCLDEGIKQCLISSNAIALTVSDKNCDCNLSTSSFLPCRHIFAVRKHFQMPLFDNDLCAERWTKSYAKKNQRAFQHLDSGADRKDHTPVTTVTRIASKKPISVQEKRKKVAPFAKLIIDLVSHACGSRFDSRMEQIELLCNSWREGCEIQITRSDDLEDINTRLNATTLVEPENASVPSAISKSARSSNDCQENTLHEGNPILKTLDGSNDCQEITMQTDGLSLIQMPTPMNIIGRPSGHLATTRKKVRGSKKTLPFTTRDNAEKIIEMLKWLAIDDDMSEALIKKEYLLCTSDLNLSSLSDSFADESVDVTLLMPYFEEAAFASFTRAIDIKKASDILFCRICEKRVIDHRIICASCLLWNHLVCVGLQRSPRSKEWFCPSCKCKK